MIPLSEVNTTQCACGHFCLAKIGKAQVQVAREMFHRLNQHQQTQWIIDYLRTYSRKEGDKWKFKYMVGTAEICPIGWRDAIGISRARFFRIKRKIKSGQIYVGLEGRAHSSSQMQRTQETMEWVSSYAANFADSMPDSGQLHLPSCLTKKAVYEMCKESLESHGLQVVSESHFYKLWSNHMSNITIPRVNRFAKCNKCILLKSKLEKTVDKKERKALFERRRKHLMRQNLERRKYYKHCRKARNNPDQYLSIIIDGMDQSKTSLPHFGHLNSKDTHGMWKLKTHLTGAIVHGHGVYSFFDSNEYPHGSNLTTNVLLRIISMFGENLPQTLYLQLDNCGRENKNRFLLSFCALLVELGVFKKIKVSFLMVGHTHEDIDQMFSRVSSYLQKNSAETMPGLISAYEKSFSPAPQGIELDYMFDISRWLQPHIEKIEVTRKPHVFRFTQTPSGKAVMHIKKWSTDSSWMSCSGDADGVLLKARPSGIPSLVRPNFCDLDIDRLENDIHNSASKYMHDTSVQWWNELFNKIKSEYDDLDPIGLWLLPTLLEDCSKRPTQAPAPCTSTVVLPDLSDEDEPLIPVSIGKKQVISQPVIPKSLQVGDLCLLNTDKWADYWPQLGEVVEIEDEKVDIKWYRASLAGKNRPEVVKDKETGRQKDWIETVSLSDIWHHGFKLTNKGRIPADIKRMIENFVD